MLTFDSTILYQIWDYYVALWDNINDFHLFSVIMGLSVSIISLNFIVKN